MTCTADTSPLLDCGHPASGHSSITTGYGTDRATGKTSCYECIHIAELAAIHDARPGDRHTGYISGDGKTWTNWPGANLGTVRYWGNLHQWSRERRYVTVTDQHRRVWSGTGAPGMWATLRLTKETYG